MPSVSDLDLLDFRTLTDYGLDPDPYRCDPVPEWLDELNFDVGSQHVRMGTRALPLDRWLLPDHHAPTELELKRRLLTEQRDRVFRCRPSAHAGAVETEALIQQWQDQHGIVPGHDHDADHALARAGLRVQEDLCLLVARQGQWRFDGASLSFPSQWLLSDKFESGPAAIHAPVAHYAEELAGRVDTFFDRLRPERPVWRRNFSMWPFFLHCLPLRQFPPGCHPDGALGTDGSPYWLRSERQTLRALPESGAILFTIRVQMAPMAVLLQRPDRAEDLARWLSAPIGSSLHHSLGANVAPVLAWLKGVWA